MFPYLYALPHKATTPQGWWLLSLCTQKSREVPIAVRAVAEAEAALLPVIEKFEKVLDTVNRRCLEAR